MIKLFELFDSAFDFFDKLAWRERFLLFLSVGAGLYFLVETSLIFPGKKSLHDLKLDIQIVEEKHEKLAAEYAVYERFSERDPDSLIKQQLAQLGNKSERLKKEIQGLSSVVVAVNEISNVLRDIALKTERVDLKALRALPPSSTPSSAEFHADFAEAENFSVQRIRLDIEADYFATLQFIESLEQLSWPLSWQSLEYQVLQYPLGKSTLMLSFLSLDEDL